MPIANRTSNDLHLFTNAPSPLDTFTRSFPVNNLLPTCYTVLLVTANHLDTSK